MHDAKEKAQNSYGRPDQQAGSSIAPITGLYEFVRRPLERVNPNGVSKAVYTAADIEQQQAQQEQAANDARDFDFGEMAFDNQ